MSVTCWCKQILVYWHTEDTALQLPLKFGLYPAACTPCYRLVSFRGECSSPRLQLPETSLSLLQSKVLATRHSDTSDTHLDPPERKSSNTLWLFLVFTPKRDAILLCHVGKSVSVLVFSFELSHSTTILYWSWLPKDVCSHKSYIDIP